MSEAITLLLADDHELVRKALRDRFDLESDMEVLADVGTADDAVAMAIRHKPRVVVLDVDMPGQVAFDAAKIIMARCPDARVIFLSAFFHDRFIEQALSVEASGYVTKSEPLEVILHAIRSVVSGVSYYSQEVQSRIVFEAGAVRLASRPQTRISTLSARELEVLRYIAQGLSKKEIATTMHLSVKTIEVHATNLMNKLGIHDRVELARYAIREGLTEP